MCKSLCITKLFVKTFRVTASSGNLSTIVQKFPFENRNSEKNINACKSRTQCAKIQICKKYLLRPFFIFYSLINKIYKDEMDELVGYSVKTFSPGSIGDSLKIGKHLLPIGYWFLIFHTDQNPMTVIFFYLTATKNFSISNYR